MTGGQTERSDFVELTRRRALTEDAARADAVRKRHARGGRTARENVADLVDEDSWVEWGRYAIAAQTRRLPREELIATTPADGVVVGLGKVDGRSTAVLAYDYTVLAGTQGMRGHRKTDRMFDVIERTGVPVVFYAEGEEDGPLTAISRWSVHSMRSRSRCGLACRVSRRGSASSTDPALPATR